MFDSSGSSCVFFQHAGVSGKLEEESKERPNCREQRFPAALSVGRHAPVQGTAYYLNSRDTVLLDYCSLNTIVVVLKNTVV